MVNQERASAFLPVKCKCGRDLRAKLEQAGSEIRCWDCHQLVPVPIPHQGQKVARELSEGAFDVIQGPALNSVLLAALIVSLVFLIPVVGTWCAVVALTLGASVYGEIIRRVGLGSSVDTVPDWRATLFPRSIVKLVLCFLMAAGTVIPLWINNAAQQQSPHFDRSGRLAVAQAWTVLPLLMMAVYARDPQGSRLGPRGLLRLLARHPVAILFALATVPACLLLIEIGLDLIFWLPGNLPFFALDFMPMPDAPDPPLIYQGIPLYRHIDFRTLPPGPFVAGYFDGLRNGYSFVGAIPASLSNPTRNGLTSEAIGLFPNLYPFARFLITLGITTCLIAAFAIQARWLGSISALERIRPKTSPTPVDPAPTTVPAIGPPSSP